VVRILPSTPIERVAFAGVALTAGFCEEVLYRGFLLYALDGVIASPWISLVLAAIAFGVGHAYQGRRGIVLTAILGVVFGLLYRFGGSLWPGIVLHAAIDGVNGYALGSLANRRSV
jgi:membrane protease YdiL (CAAX protease family)